VAWSCSTLQIALQIEDGVTPFIVLLIRCLIERVVCSSLQASLRSKPKPKQMICVANVGLHDEEILLPNQTSHYVEHVKALITLLQGACAKIVWIAISACKCDLKFPQSNPKSANWNQLVETMIEDTFRSNVLFLDIFNMSLNVKLHDDNVHLGSAYYRALAGYMFKI
jgi:hypothetical protein